MQTKSISRANVKFQFVLLKLNKTCTRHKYNTIYKTIKHLLVSVQNDVGRYELRQTNSVVSYVSFQLYDFSVVFSQKNFFFYINNKKGG